MLKIKENVLYKQRTGWGTMHVSNIYSAEHRYQAAGNSRASEETVYVGAVTEAASEDEGIFLGLTMIPEEGSSVVYGMRAMLSEESTPDKPIVQIISNLDGKKEVYNIDISQVDPQNATRMDMFALCSYEINTEREPAAHLAPLKPCRFMKKPQSRMAARSRLM